jgi:glycine oxidase
VIEKSAPGAEASSAAAGMIAPQLEAKGPGPLLSLGIKSRSLYPAWITRIEEISKVSTGFRACGMVRGGAPARLEALARWQTELGLRAHLKDNELHLPDEHQVDPRLLMRSLTTAAHHLGVEFRIGEVRGVQDHTVEIDAERLTADAVVVAAGAWTSFIANTGLDFRRLQPVKGQMVELKLLTSPFEATRVSDFVYAVSRGDGRVICGSTMERVGFDKRTTAAATRSILTGALEMCPVLADAEITSTWAGLRPCVDDELPVIGPGPIPGLHLATGHFRSGILLAPITAQMMGHSLDGKAPPSEWSPFQFNRFPS